MFIEEIKDKELTNNKIFELLDARFSKKYILYEHLHNSYNELINTIINYYYTNDNIFEENRVGELVYRYRFKYDNIYIRPPLSFNGDSLMYPSDARERSLTYSIKFVGKITQIQEIYDLNLKKVIGEKIIEPVFENETILAMPCMVRSKYCSLQINRDYNKKECEYDPGGFFIVNGAEKYVLSQEKIVENKPLVFSKKDGANISYKVKINSRSSNLNIMMQGIEIHLGKNYNINIKVPILNEVSVFVLMRALGLETDREIIKYIIYDDNDVDMFNILKIAIDSSKKDGKKLILNKEDAIYSLTNKIRVVKKYSDKDRKLQYDEKKEHLEALLRNAFLPHIKNEHNSDILKSKAYFLGYMVNKLLNCYLERHLPDDRDSFINKRVEMPGDLIFDLYKQHYKKMLNECNKFFKKRSGSNHENPLNIINQIKPYNIEQGIKSAMMTGNWIKKKGVAQMYPRLTFLQSISVLRRVDDPHNDNSTMKLTGPRHYHPSQTGFLCLTGDTSILLSNGDVKFIKDIINDNNVVSVDTNTMTQVNTPIFNWFSQKCDNLIEITTITGRTIKCTPEHKLLTWVNNSFNNNFKNNFENNFEMVEVNKMTTDNYLVIKNSMKPIIIDTPYNYHLINKITYKDKIITQEELEIIARIIGFTRSYLNGYIVLKNEKDMFDLVDDIKFLGFDINDVHKNYDSWVENYNSELLYILSYFAFVDNVVSEWLLNSNKRIQREFINGLFSNANSYTSLKLNRPILKYTGQILQNFNIVYNIVCGNSQIEGDLLVIDESFNNLEKFYDLINYRYNYNSKITNAPFIEYIKYKNHSSENNLSYDNFVENMVINEDLLMIKIKNINKISEPEIVYDFETISNTHSFVANSIVSSNCCVESPEHANIGLVKNLGLLSSICIGSQEQANIIYDLLILNEKFIHIDVHTPLQLINQTKIFLNGEWIGLSEQAFELYTEFKKLKQNGIILRTNSIVYDVSRNEIKIYTDSGRLYRPLLNVENNKIVLTDNIIDSVLKDKTLKGFNKWDILIDKYPNAIDFVDVEEQYYYLIADNNKQIIEMKEREKNIYDDSNKPNVNRYDESLILNYTHCEIHPSMTIGLIACNIPFSNHNQGNRNMFQYAQGKQAMSYYNSHYRDRLDISYILDNAQKPLVDTRISKYIHTDALPCGEQAIVAIGCYTGHNQDDSIIANQSAIDRGLFRSTSLRKHNSKIEKNQSTSADDIFMKPDVSKLIGIRHANYDKLNDKGYIPEETVIENNDVIIGKVTPIQPTPGSNKCYKDSSEIYKSQETAIIDKVFTGIHDAEGYEMIKIRTRSERIPRIGDKFCSKHGQKGIIGLTLSQSDMPFTREGISPDLIISPLAIPGRLTIAQLLECLLGKIGAIKGMTIDGTPFNDIDIEKAKDVLESLGYERNATEYLYNGMTGKRLHLPIYIGPTYYQRLKHLVMDKIHCLRTDICEVLTFDGWKKYNELTKNDLIATLSDDNLVYENPLNIFYYPNFTGDMYHVSNDNINLDTTMQHRMWISKEQNNTWTDFDFEFAENVVGQKCRYKKNANWNCSEYHFDIFESKINFNMNCWILIFAYWILYGYIDNGNCNIVFVNNNQSNNISGFKQLINIFKELNYIFCVIGNKIILQNKIIYNYLNTIKENKYFPEWCFRLDKFQTRTLLKSFLTNDNYFDEKMADQIQQLCLHAEYVANITKLNNFYSINIISYGENNNYIVNNNTLDDHIYHYEGAVFCLEVSTGVFMVRQNGIQSWTGNSRPRGLITMLTRQAPGGRSRDGGLRCGEMERDSLISHGLSKFLKERFLNISDAYSCYVCDICGLFAQRVIKKENKMVPQSSDTYHCISCKNKTKISKVVIPYAFKLLIQELMSMNIAPRIRTTQYNI